MQSANQTRRMDAPRDKLDRDRTQGDEDVVRKVIDLECLLPPDEQGKPRQYHEQAFAVQRGTF